MLDEALGLLDHHFGHLHMAHRRFVEGRRNDFALYRALHIGDFFRPLINQQDDEIAFGMIGGNRLGDVLEKNRLAGARRRNDQRALALANGCHNIDDT